MPPRTQGTIHVCPLCHELASYSDDWGWSITCTHEPYRTVEPVEVQGTIVKGAWRFPLPNPKEWEATVGAAMLDQQEKADRKRAEWLALSCDERVAIREKQRAANPMAFMMSDNLKQQYVHMISRQIYGEPETITVVCTKCQETGCENTVTKPNPRYNPDAPSPADFWNGSYTIKVEGGSNA